MLAKFKSPATWLHGLIATTISGAAHAGAGFIVAPQTFNLGEGLIKLLELAFISGLISAFAYLQTSPLPELEKEGEEK